MPGWLLDKLNLSKWPWCLNVSLAFSQFQAIGNLVFAFVDNRRDELNTFSQAIYVAARAGQSVCHGLTKSFSYAGKSTYIQTSVGLWRRSRPD